MRQIASQRWAVMGISSAMVLMAVAVVAQTAPGAPKLPAFTKSVTLKLWDWGGSNKAMIAAFNKDYPNIKIQWSNVGAGPDEYNKLLTALKAGTGAPDVAAIEYGFLPSFISFGGLVDLAQYGANDFKSLYPDWAWQQVAPQGSAVYGIPGDQGPLALVYREDQYRKYGLNVPKTWAQFEANAVKLSQATKGKVKIANFFSTYAPWFMGLVWGSGGNFWTKSGDAWTQSFANPKSKTVLNYWGKLIEKGYVSTYQDFTQDFYKALDSDNVISSVEAAWGPGTFASSLSKKTAGKWRVAPLPQWTASGKFTTGNWGGTSYAVTTQSKEPQAAMIFALWMMAHPNAMRINWVTQGVFPAAKAGTTLPELQDMKLDPNKFFGANVAGAYLQASKSVLYALGNNPEAAMFSGVPVQRYRAFLFVFMGVMAGFAAVCLTSRIGSTRPNIAQGWELDVITMVVLGGVGIVGGTRSIFGVFLAVLTLGMIIFGTAQHSGHRRQRHHRLVTDRDNCAAGRAAPVDCTLTLELNSNEPLIRFSRVLGVGLPLLCGLGQS